MLKLHQFPCLEDNYGFLLHDPASGETVCIDTPDAEAYLREATARGWTITQIWNTHWHPDHVGGNDTIKLATNCRIAAPVAEIDQIGCIDLEVRPGDVITLGTFEADVIDVGGHTNGHIAYHIAEVGMVFVGDALFPMGCGRMFEGTPTQYWGSLSRLKALPPATLVYCAHEYTLANAHFALYADPDNEAVRSYVADVEALRACGTPTVPTDIGRECAANPFLRADRRDVQEHWVDRGAILGDAAATFAALRKAKDDF